MLSFARSLRSHTIGMLAIKLQRIGKKHQPSYRVVVAQKKSKLGGPPVEDVGFYNPFTKVMTVKKERVLHWLGVGAKPSVSIHNLLVREKIIDGAKVKIRMKKKMAGETAPADGAAEPSAAPEPAEEKTV